MENSDFNLNRFDDQVLRLSARKTAFSPLTLGARGRSMKNKHRNLSAKKDQKGKVGSEGQRMLYMTKTRYR